MNRAELNGSIQLDTGNRDAVNAAVGEAQFQKPEGEEQWSFDARVPNGGLNATETDGGNSEASSKWGTENDFYRKSSTKHFCNIDCHGLLNPSWPDRGNAEPGITSTENYIRASLPGAYSDFLLHTHIYQICFVNTAGLSGSIQLDARCRRLAETVAGEEEKLNDAFVISWFFDAEVLNNGTVVGVPAGETLEFSFAQGLNFDRKFEATCQTPLQHMPVMACDNCFDQTAEMQEKQKHFSNGSTTTVNSGRADLPKVGNNINSGSSVAEMHGEGIKDEGLSSSNSSAAVPVREFQRETTEQRNLCQGNPVFWSGEDDDFINQYSDMLVHHPYLRGACYAPPTTNGGNSDEDLCHEVTVHERMYKGRYACKGNDEPARATPIRESGGASISIAKIKRKTRMSRLSYSAEEIEALSPENRELYYCLADYTDSDSGSDVQVPQDSGRSSRGEVP